MANGVIPLELPVWKKLAFSGIVFVPALVLIETALRLAGLAPSAESTQNARPVKPLPGIDAFEYFAISDPQLGFRNRPDGTFLSLRIEGNPLSTTDEYGYRNGSAWPGDGRSPIVLFIGDSITFCSEVNDDQTGASEVAKLLAKEFDVRVLNAGVRGYGTLQSKRMLIECLQRFPDIVVVVYTHCGNDPMENMVPNLRFPAKAPVIMRDAETGNLREVEVSDPVAPWGRAIFPWTPLNAPPVKKPATQSTAEWIESHSAIWSLVTEPWYEFREDYLPPREFPGNEVLSPADHDYWGDWATQNGGDEIIQHLLVEMNQICRSRGAAFLATDYLTGLNDHRSDRFAQLCAAAGVRFASIDRQFAGASESLVSRRVDGERDEHYSALGTKAYAAGLAPAIKQLLRSSVTSSTPDTNTVRND